MTISIIIPAYNEAKGLGVTLQKLQEAIGIFAGKKYDWEIIVCDNNSTDATAELARQAGAKVVFEPINQIGRARNTGAMAANGDWLFFLDADSYPRPALMQEILQIIEGGKHIGCGTTVEVQNGSWFNKLRMERLNFFFRLFKYCGGVFIACERQAFVQARGFSQELYAFEEFDFVRRLKRVGRREAKRFTILYRSPIVTSGRKGELRPANIFDIIYAHSMGLLLFLLYYLLPSSWFRRINRPLKYWYAKR